MSATFFWKREAPKKNNTYFIYLKDFYYVMDGPNDMNVGVF